MEMVRVETTKEEKITGEIMELMETEKVSIKEALTILEDVKNEIMNHVVLRKKRAAESERWVDVGQGPYYPRR